MQLSNTLTLFQAPSLLPQGGVIPSGWTLPPERGSTRRGRGSSSRMVTFVPLTPFQLFRERVCPPPWEGLGEVVPIRMALPPHKGGGLGRGSILPPWGDKRGAFSIRRLPRCRQCHCLSRRPVRLSRPATCWTVRSSLLGAGEPGSCG